MFRVRVTVRARVMDMERASMNMYIVSSLR